MLMDITVESFIRNRLFTVDGIKIKNKIFDMIIGREVYNNDNPELCRLYKYILNSFNNACFLLIDFKNDLPVRCIF